LLVIRWLAFMGRSWCVRARQRLWPVVAGESGMVGS